MLYITASIILIILSNLIIYKLSNTRNALLFFILLAAALFCGLVTGINLQDLLSLLRRGFAESAANTGVIIIVCHLYAVLLYKLGVYEVLASLILHVGRNRYPSFFLGISGGIASVPASGESGYPVFSPLARSVSGKTGISGATTALSLASGIYVTHALIVPAYGPLVSSGIMNANLLLLFVLGLFISVPGIFAADYFSRRYAGNFELDIVPDMTDRNAPENFSLKHTFAVFTIVLPIVLMLLKAAGSIQSRPFGSGIVYRFIYFTGDPAISILLTIGIFVLYLRIKKISINMTEITGESLKQSAQILLIAAAAGSFAIVFRTTVIMKVIPVSLPEWAGLFIPFLAAVLFKLLHGNSTVAMISASSIAFASIYGMKISPELSILAAGAGSMIVSHANDPYFWIVSKFSGMPVKTTYRLFTVASLISGVITFMIVLLLGFVM